MTSFSYDVCMFYIQVEVHSRHIKADNLYFEEYIHDHVYAQITSRGAFCTGAYKVPKFDALLRRCHVCERLHLQPIRAEWDLGRTYIAIECA